ncbi:hypothetical protein R3W88_007996 [Solanum pinnatisectum]|uniref:Craniofacial development protein 2-like n=1 Tax=Solanum pinnatisectum TaxID=50273 RepID=A0AAV9M6N8_9SOLN|nr:hypothetical protein R3W88_007996 [Solanum pinnatisectum]
MLYWVDLDEVVRRIPNKEKIFIGGDINGQIAKDSTDFDDVRGGFCFGARSGGGALLLDFAKDFEFVISNSYFLKCQNQLETFRSMDCVVIPSENIRILYRLFMMNLEIKRHRSKKTLYDGMRFKLGGFTPTLSQVMGEKFIGVGSGVNSDYVKNMWDKADSCIRRVAIEVLTVSTINFGGHQRY